MKIKRSPRLKIKRTPSNRFWSAHTHSRYSNNDAMPSVKDMVARAVELGQRALGLTDHGNMAGSVELYVDAENSLAVALYEKSGFSVASSDVLYASPNSGRRPLATMHVSPDPTGRQSQENP